MAHTMASDMPLRYKRIVQSIMYDVDQDLQPYLEDTAFSMRVTIMDPMVRLLGPEQNVSLLACACYHRSVKCVRVLLESPRGVDVNQSHKHANWLTPAHYLMLGAMHWEDMLEDEESSLSNQLVAHDSDTPAILAILDLMSSLREYALDINAQSGIGSVLNLALMHTAAPVVVRVLQLGAIVGRSDYAYGFDRYDGIVRSRLAIMALLSARLDPTRPRRMKLSDNIIRRIMRCIVNDA